jgi:hypothetical protein
VGKVSRDDLLGQPRRQSGIRDEERDPDDHYARPGLQPGFGRASRVV